MKFRKWYLFLVVLFFPISLFSMEIIDNKTVNSLGDLCIKSIINYGKSPENYNRLFSGNLSINADTAQKIDTNINFNHAYRKAIESFEYKTITEFEPNLKFPWIVSIYGMFKRFGTKTTDAHLCNNGKHAFVVKNGIGSMFDIKSGKALFTLPTRGIYRVVVNDNFICVPAAGNVLAIWDINTGNFIKNITLFPDNIENIDGKYYQYILDNQTNQVTKVNKENGNQESTIYYRTDLDEVSLSNDGKLCVVSFSKGNEEMEMRDYFHYLKIFNVEANKILKIFDKPWGLVTKNSNFIFVHDYEAGLLGFERNNLDDSFYKDEELKKYYHPIFSDNGSLLAACNARGGLSWNFKNLATGESKKEYLSTIGPSVINSQEEFFLYEQEDAILIYDLKNSANLVSSSNVFRIRKNDNNISKVNLNTSGRKALKLFNGKIKIYSLNNLLYLWKDLNWQQKLAIIIFSQNKNLCGLLKATFDFLDPEVKKLLNDSYHIEDDESQNLWRKKFPSVSRWIKQFSFLPKEFFVYSFIGVCLPFGILGAVDFCLKLAKRKSNFLRNYILMHYFCLFYIKRQCQLS
ncbi:MAG: hypothetical protein WDZ41_05225 [Candidatus Babeliales bacterium]